MSLPVQIGQTLAFLSIFRGLCECNRGIAGAACAARLLSKGCQGWAEIRAVCALPALAVIYRRRWAADDSATVCLWIASLDGFKPLIDNDDQMTCQPPVEAFCAAKSGYVGIPGRQVQSPMRYRLALSLRRVKISRTGNLDRNKKSCAAAEARLALRLGERLLLRARISRRGFGRGSPVAAENRFTQFLKVQTRTLPVTLAGIAADFFCGLEMRV